MSVAQLCPSPALVARPLDKPFDRPVRSGKVVLISYAFPPDNTSGAIRVGKFVQHLSTHYGWSLDVITPRRKSMSSQFVANQMTFAESVSIRQTRNFEIFDVVARLRRKKHDAQESGTPASPVKVGETASDGPGTNRKRSMIARLSDLLEIGRASCR